MKLHKSKEEIGATSDEHDESECRTFRLSLSYALAGNDNQLANHKSEPLSEGEGEIQQT